MLTHFLRERFPNNDLSPAEINERAREIIDAIDAETGNRTAHAARVTQIYQTARLIQRARHGGARAVTAHKVVALLMLVLARSYGIGIGAR